MSHHSKFKSEKAMLAICLDDKKASACYLDPQKKIKSLSFIFEKQSYSDLPYYFYSFKNFCFVGNEGIIERKRNQSIYKNTTIMPQEGSLENSSLLSISDFTRNIDLWKYFFKHILISALKSIAYIGYCVVSVPDYLEKTIRENVIEVANSVGLPIKRVVDFSEALLFAGGFPHLNKGDTILVLYKDTQSFYCRIVQVDGDKIKYLSKRQHYQNFIDREKSDTELFKKVILNFIALCNLTIDNITRVFVNAQPAHYRDLLFDLLNEMGFRNLIVFAKGSEVVPIGAMLNAFYLKYGSELKGIDIPKKEAKPKPKNPPVSDQTVVIDLSKTCVIKHQVKKEAPSDYNITIIREDNKESLCFTNQKEITVGRSEKNNIIFSGIQYAWVSGHHISIKHEGGSFYLIDYSRHGTSLNGKKIEKSKKIKLKKGDKIVLVPPKGPDIIVDSIN